MAPFTAKNIAPLASGLSALALGSVGVFAFILLMMLAGRFEEVPGPVTTLLGLELIVSLLMILIGPICCFFSPLKRSTKAKLLMTFLSLVLWARLEGGGAWLLLFLSFLCGISFAFALCDELEAPEIKIRLNQVVLMGVGSPLVAFLSALTESLSPLLCWTGLTVALILSLLAVLGLLTALLSLVQRVRQLQRELPEQAENYTGISRF